MLDYSGEMTVILDYILFLQSVIINQETTIIITLSKVACLRFAAFYTWITQFE